MNKNLLNIKTKVLVVDDNLVNQIIITKMLSKMGIETRVAKSGQEALVRVNKESFDLILLDCQIPDGDGYEVVKKIRALNNKKKETFVVAMTAFYLDESKQKCLDSGMNGYMIKPVTFGSLLEVMHKWVTKRTGEHVDYQALDSLSDLDETDDKETLVELVSVFVENTPYRIEKLVTALDQHDLKIIQEESHALKTSAFYLGAKSLSCLCENLESSCKEMSWKQITVMVKDIQSEYQQVEPVLLSEKEQALLESKSNKIA